MRGKLIIAAILVQFLILGWMAGQREWIVRSGPRVWLRTAPVDPRDLLRGDYVTLGYDISTIRAAKFGPGIKNHLAGMSMNDDAFGRGSEIVVYVALTIDPQSGLAEVASVDLTRPVAGPFLKGRVRVSWTRGTTMLMGVRYGIDAYFVQQGSGLELERRVQEGMRAGSQVPLEMQVALGSNGVAVLTGHRLAKTHEIGQ